jgi:hypothetical protein
VLRCVFASRFQYSFGHFLHEQRNTVRALNDVLPDARRNELVPDDIVDHCLDVVLHLCGAHALLKVPASNTFAAIGSPLSTPCVNQQLFEFVDAASPNWHLGDNLVVGVHEQARPTEEDAGVAPEQRWMPSSRDIFKTIHRNSKGLLNYYINSQIPFPANSNQYRFNNELLSNQKL